MYFMVTCWETSCIFDMHFLTLKNWLWMSLTADENPKVPKKEVENFYLRESVHRPSMYTNRWYYYTVTCYCKVYLTVTWYYKGIWLWLNITRGLFGNWCYKGIWLGIDITRAFRPIMLDLKGHLDHDLILQSIFDFDLILQRHWLWLDIWLGIDIIKGIWLGVDITKCSCVGVPPS